jgi:hypothetical protein
MGTSPREDKDFILANMLELARGVARPTTKFVVGRAIADA